MPSTKNERILQALVASGQIANVQSNAEIKTIGDIKKPWFCLTVKHKCLSSIGFQGESMDEVIESFLEKLRADLTTLLKDQKDTVTSTEEMLSVLDTAKKEASLSEPTFEETLR